MIFLDNTRQAGICGLHSKFDGGRRFGMDRKSGCLCELHPHDGDQQLGSSPIRLFGHVYAEEKKRLPHELTR